MDTIDVVRGELQSAIEEFDIDAVTTATTKLVETMRSDLPAHPEAFVRVLKKCLDEFDFEQSTELCDQLIAHLQGRDSPYPICAANEVLQMLQKKQLFKQVIKTAEQFLQSGSGDPVIQKRYAQALIETAHYTAAINVLNSLATQCQKEKNDGELAEAKGLLGRVYKQIYINAAASGTPVGGWVKNALMQSFDIYKSEYTRNNNLRWHGVNAIALWHRGTKDGLGLPCSRDEIGKISADVLAAIEPPQDESAKATQSRPDMWSMATAAEICLATGDHQRALDWIFEYVDDSHSHSDAFEVGSTLRQFEQVWQLSEDDPDQSRILQVLRAALLKRKGGSISLDKPQSDLATIDGMLSDSSFEAVLGTERFKNLKWLKKGFERAQCVCKFTDRFGDSFGTGFLLRSEALRLPVPDQWVVLTNAHVISNNELEQRGNPRARSPETSFVQFEASAEPDREFLIDRILAWSPRNELDFSVLALREQGEFTNAYPIAEALPLVNDDQRIYLIGHPRGGQLSFSLYDNMLLDHDVPKVHYRSPTLGGSSGSPVFNQSWDLIGLHHAGGTGMRRLNGQSGTYEANEGLWIQSIIGAIESTTQGMMSTRA